MTRQRAPCRGPHEVDPAARVALFSHLVSFDFVYPDHRDSVPSGLMSEMAHRLAAQPKEPFNRICFGTLLSREQYVHDVQQLGYIDARLPPHGTMTPDEIAIWSEAIDKKN